MENTAPQPTQTGPAAAVTAAPRRMLAAATGREAVPAPATATETAAAPPIPVPAAPETNAAPTSTALVERPVATAPAPASAEASPAGAPPVTANGDGTAPVGVELAGPSGEQQAANDEAAEVSATGAGGAGTTPTVTLLMPPPPDGLSEADNARLNQVSASAARAANAQEQLPTPTAGVDNARAAVTEPPEETAARAEAALANELATAPAPSPAIEEFCARMREVIHSRQPPDEESLARSRQADEARAAGRELEAGVQGDVDNVQGSYDDLQESPQGTPEQLGGELETPPASVETPPIGAARAVPDAVPEENVSLDADVGASATAMRDAGMESEPAQLAQSGPIAEARDAQGELGSLAETGPDQVIAEQAAARASASADMAALQAQALEVLHASRAGTAVRIGGQQTGMVGHEEQMRAQVSASAQQIFTTAQNTVRTQLEPLVPTAMQRWNSEIDILSTRFEADLKQVKDWLGERYSGVGGAVVEFFEDIVGKPAWVTRAYNDAERRFGDGVCDVLREISTQINSVIQTCEEIIANANREIHELFNSLPVELQAWAESERASYSQRLDNLHQEVLRTRDDLTANLVESAGSAVQEVRERIHELRLAAGGLVGRVMDAIERFAENPAKFILEALLELVGIPPPSFWALVDQISSVIDDIADDPMNFANNLASALGEGFQRFFDNFKDHIIGGFFDWLFSGLGAVGVNIPSDFSLKSIITFFLELMGITWPRIRQLLARHIGEENVALIEKAYELVSTLIEMGPEGIFEMIKEQLNPQNILDMVIDAAIDFMIEALITAVTPRIIALFNPAGAIVQAIEIIYRILKWVFDNAARIFSLIETVVNGAAELIAGNVSGMATAVEGALARLIAPVIDFLAGFLGMGDLPDKIANTIRGFQDWVFEILDRIIGWLADRAKSLLSALGIGTEEEPEEGEEDDGETITEEFTMQGEPHVLRTKIDKGEITLASGTEKPAEDQIAAGAEEVKEEGDGEKAARAAAALANMKSLLAKIHEELRQVKAGDRENSDRSLLRQYSRETRIALDQYGSEFIVKEIADGLPDYGPLVVGPHRIPGKKEADDSTRESHHVPPKELASSLGEQMEATGIQLLSESDEGANKAGAVLKERGASIAKNSEGLRLSAISLHRVTHQNAGGVAVHAAAMRDDIVSAIHAIDAKANAETVQILNAVSTEQLAVNPSGAAIASFLERLNEQLDEEEDAAERRQQKELIKDAEAAVAEINEGAEEDAERAAVSKANALAKAAFDNSLTQGMVAVELAVTHSMLDGPKDEKEGKLNELESLAHTTWASENIIAG